MKLTIDFDGPDGALRRELRTAFAFREPLTVHEPIDQRVTIRVYDQPASARSNGAMGTTRIRSDQYVDIDVDFQGRLSGNPAEADVDWSVDDPNAVGTFEDTREEGDASKARFTATPGKAGIATITWTAGVDNQVLTGSETVEVEGEGVVLAGQIVTVGDQPTAA